MKFGRRYYSNYFLMFVLKRSNTSSPSRFGFITSKKVGDAVVRNRLRRQFREVVRTNISKVTTGFDTVFVVSPKAVGQDFSTLKGDIEKQLRVSGVVLN